MNLRGSFAFFSEPYGTAFCFMSDINLAYRRFGKLGILVYGTINHKVRKLVTMIYVKKLFRECSNREVVTVINNQFWNMKQGISSAYHIF